MKLVLAAPVGRPDDREMDSFVGTMEQTLHELGHGFDVFRFPTILEPGGAMEYALALGLLDFGADAQRLITLGWHCHLLRHPAKIAVIDARDRVLDLLDTGANPPATAHIRSAIAVALRGARRIVVADQATSEQVGALTAIEPLVCGPHLAKREAAEVWLD